jgi:hypothetical protein
MKSKAIGVVGCLAVAVLCMAVARANRIDADVAGVSEISDAEAATLVGGCNKYKPYPAPPAGTYWACVQGAYSCPIPNPVMYDGEGQESEGQILCGACGLRYSGPEGFCGGF